MMVSPGTSFSEVKVVLSRLNNGNATGMDGIPVEAWRCFGEEGIDYLGYDAWDVRAGVNTMEWRDSLIVPIYKDNRDIYDCVNFRGFTLMSHTIKNMARIIEGWHREETTIGE